MITNKLILLIGLLALVVPCLGAAHFIGKRDHDDTDDHETSCTAFPKFLEQVNHAKYEDYAYSNVESREAFECMKKHVLHMYDGVSADKVTTFVLEKEYADCIAVEEQPTVREYGIHKIDEPAEPVCMDKTEKRTDSPETPQYAESPLKLGLKDRFGNPISCPEHTIPMARLTLKKLTQFRTLEDFLAKSPEELGQLAKRGSDAGIHLHAVGIQDVDNHGGDSWLNLWNPKTYNASDFSLSQQWYSGGTGDDLQTVEGGWQVYPRFYNTEKASLFIYRTNRNYQPGSGCYNLDCPGFVQTNNNWFLGGIWDHYSKTNGAQWGFQMQWQLSCGNWWLFLKGPGKYEPVGYYPTSIFNGGQMSKLAKRVDYGGEVYRDQPGHSWPQMGSGALAAKGYGKAAFQRSIFYIDCRYRGVWAALRKVVTGTSCYSIDIQSPPGPGKYIFFGGQGTDKCI